MRHRHRPSLYLTLSRRSMMINGRNMLLTKWVVHLQMPQIGEHPRRLNLSTHSRYDPHKHKAPIPSGLPPEQAMRQKIFLCTHKHTLTNLHHPYRTTTGPCDGYHYCCTTSNRKVSFYLFQRDGIRQRSQHYPYVSSLLIRLTFLSSPRPFQKNHLPATHTATIAPVLASKS